MKKSFSVKKVTRRDFMAAAGTLAGSPLIMKSRSAEAVGHLSGTLTVERDALHPLPKTQYGHFIEHLGKCIKGGIWAEGEEPEMFLGGVRRDLLADIRSIHPALIRYPGGCFADGYHWQDGIGPRESRPSRPNLAWGKLGPAVGPIEDNHFGTDEFLRLCEAVGAEPMLTANVGSGTAQEAADWVEYCNGPAGTRFGAERVKNGHPEPYRVKYWFIGNEIYGSHEIGHKTPAEYVKVFHDYARAMRARDPDIKLIAVGDFRLAKEGERVNQTVLEGAGEVMDYLSIHRYVPVRGPKEVLAYSVGRLQGARFRGLYYDVLASVTVMEEALEAAGRDVRAYAPKNRPIRITFDEWNLWFVFVDDIIQTNYNLRDGLWTATVLNLLHRRAPEVPIANLAQMVNCLGIIISDQRGTFLTPSALVFRLYTEQAGDELLPCAFDGPKIPHPSELPVLDVSATRGPDRLALFLVNRHWNAPLVLKVWLPGQAVKPPAALYEIYHDNPVQYNTFQEPSAVKITESKIVLPVERQERGCAVTVNLKPHSMACLKLDLDHP